MKKLMESIFSDESLYAKKPSDWKNLTLSYHLKNNFYETCSGNVIKLDIGLLTNIP